VTTDPLIRLAAHPRQLGALRGPDESFSDVIPRLVEIEGRP
jgi:hypothetical protein